MYASGNYLLDGKAPCGGRTIVVAQYGANRKPAPSQRQLQDGIKEYYSKGFNASSVEVVYKFATR